MSENISKNIWLSYVVLIGALLWPFLYGNRIYLFENGFSAAALYSVFGALLGISLFISFVVWGVMKPPFLVRFNVYFGLFWLSFFSYPMAVAIVQFTGGWWTPYYLIGWVTGSVIVFAATWQLYRRVDILPIFSIVVTAIIFTGGVQLALETMTRDSDWFSHKEKLTIRKAGQLDINQDRLVTRFSEYRVTDRRNIYFFMPDGYPRTDALAIANVMDNRPFEETLEGLGFVVPPKSMANTAYTEKSVSSVFSMRNLFDADAKFLPKHTDSLIFNIDNGGWSVVHQLLKQSGYDIFVAGKNDKGNIVKCDGACPIVDPKEKWAQRKTRLGVLRMTPIFAVLERWFFGITTDLLQYQWRQEFDLSDGQINTMNSESPFLLFMHTMMTHEPFLFDENCNYLFNPDITQEMPPMMGKGAFEPFQAGVVKCANKSFEAQVKRILAVDPNAVIIMQSDHGMRRKEPGIFPKELNDLNWLGNFTALRMPRRCRGEIPDNFFNFDTFPVVLSCLGNMKVPTEAAMQAR